MDVSPHSHITSSKKSSTNAHSHDLHAHYQNHPDALVLRLLSSRISDQSTSQAASFPSPLGSTLNDHEKHHITQFFSRFQYIKDTIDPSAASSNSITTKILTFLENASIIHLPSAATVFGENEVNEFLYFVIEGEVRTYTKRSKQSYEESKLITNGCADEPLNHSQVPNNQSSAPFVDAQALGTATSPMRKLIPDKQQQKRFALLRQHKQYHCFGESSTKFKRSLALVASESALLLRVKWQNFNSIFDAISKKLTLILPSLQNLFEGFSTQALTELVYAFAEPSYISFSTGQCVYKEGDNITSLFFVKSGHFEVRKRVSKQHLAAVAAAAASSVTTAATTTTTSTSTTSNIQTISSSSTGATTTAATIAAQQSASTSAASPMKQRQTEKQISILSPGELFGYESLSIQQFASLSGSPTSDDSPNKPVTNPSDDAQDSYRSQTTEGNIIAPSVTTPQHIFSCRSTINQSRLLCIEISMLRRIEAFERLFAHLTQKATKKRTYYNDRLNDMLALHASPTIKGIRQPSTKTVSPLRHQQNSIISSQSTINQPAVASISSMPLNQTTTTGGQGGIGISPMRQQQRMSVSPKKDQLFGTQSSMQGSTSIGLGGYSPTKKGFVAGTAFDLPSRVSFSDFLQESMFQIDVSPKSGANAVIAGTTVANTIPFTHTSSNHNPPQQNSYSNNQAIVLPQAQSLSPLRLKSIISLNHQHHPSANSEKLEQNVTTAGSAAVTTTANSTTLLSKRFQSSQNITNIQERIPQLKNSLADSTLASHRKLSLNALLALPLKPQLNQQLQAIQSSREPATSVQVDEIKLINRFKFDSDINNNMNNNNNIQNTQRTITTTTTTVINAKQPQLLMLQSACSIKEISPPPNTDQEIEQIENNPVSSTTTMDKSLTALTFSQLQFPQYPNRRTQSLHSNAASAASNKLQLIDSFQSAKKQNKLLFIAQQPAAYEDNMSFTNSNNNEKQSSTNSPKSLCGITTRLPQLLGEHQQHQESSSLSRMSNNNNNGHLKRLESIKKIVNNQKREFHAQDQLNQQPSTAAAAAAAAAPLSDRPSNASSSSTALILPKILQQQSQSSSQSTIKNTNNTSSILPLFPNALILNACTGRHSDDRFDSQDALSLTEQKHQQQQQQHLRSQSTKDQQFQSPSVKFKGISQKVTTCLQKILKRKLQGSLTQKNKLNIETTPNNELNPRIDLISFDFNSLSQQQLQQHYHHHHYNYHPHRSNNKLIILPDDPSLSISAKQSNSTVANPVSQSLNIVPCCKGDQIIYQSQTKVIHESQKISSPRLDQSPLSRAKRNGSSSTQRQDRIQLVISSQVNKDIPGGDRRGATEIVKFRDNNNLRWKSEVRSRIHRKSPQCAPPAAPPILFAQNQLQHQSQQLHQSQQQQFQQSNSQSQLAAEIAITSNINNTPIVPPINFSKNSPTQSQLLQQRSKSETHQLQFQQMSVATPLKSLQSQSQSQTQQQQQQQQQQQPFFQQQYPRLSEQIPSAKSNLIKQMQQQAQFEKEFQDAQTPRVKSNAMAPVLGSISSSSSSQSSASTARRLSQSRGSLDSEKNNVFRFIINNSISNNISNSNQMNEISTPKKKSIASPSMRKDDMRQMIYEQAIARQSVVAGVTSSALDKRGAAGIPFMTGRSLFSNQHLNLISSARNSAASTPTGASSNQLSSQIQ